MSIVDQTKRKQAPGPGEQPAKRVKTGAKVPCRAHTGEPVHHALLSRLYPNLCTLREYVLAKLPRSSRLRRKKIASVGLPDEKSEDARSCADIEAALGRLLDTTIVGFCDNPPAKPDNRWEQWVSFSQRGDESYVTLSDGSAGAFFSQREIVDFVIWLLFSRERKTGSRPNHLLCDGFRRDVNPRAQSAAANLGGGIPGLFALHANRQAQALKAAPWPELLTLLGKAGEQVMMDLLLDCGVFTKIEAGRGNYSQLSGIAVSELDYLASQNGITSEVPAHSSRSATTLKTACRSPSTIVFARSRMLYARAALNARGLVHFGLRHIHALNRFPLKTSTAAAADSPSREPVGATAAACDEATLRVMMYIFPRQFGLHNVFTSTVDRSQTAQKLQDYTLREEEITKKFFMREDGEQRLKVRIPRRLRGLPSHLVQRLQVLHARCSYSKLLQHHCPAPGQFDMRRKARTSNGKLVSGLSKSQMRQGKSRRKSKNPSFPTPPPKCSSLVDVATPASHVSAFCQAVLSTIIPDKFWGSNSTQAENKTAFLKNVDRFLHLRRFEQLSLHDVTQGLKIMDIDWLAPPTLHGQKSSHTDTTKRFEIFHEFLYYLFDSLLIPLIRSNFYVTESSAHRYRLFFFRHDVWRSVAEPAMASLKAKMFEEVKLEDALRILDSRRLGFSQVRLLPKGPAVRPIMNLRRRTLVKGDRKMLGSSINTILGPISHMLKLEKELNPSRLGAAMFSVGDIYERIKEYKATLTDNEQPLYFAKVDVQAAFDTIPQDAIIELMGRVPGQTGYKVVKHVEVSQSHMALGAESKSRPQRRWQSIAKAADDRRDFTQVLEDQLAPNKKSTVFVENVLSRTYDTRALVALMTSHIQQNLVKIGKKYYRQSSGIPQGSVISSTLCNYFYADLETKRLSFLRAKDSLLLRLIDDFLLITTDKAKARRFVETMHRGIPEYGVTVNPSKSMVNFDMISKGVTIPKTTHGQAFPYCGTLIDCRSLDITRNRDRADDTVIFDSLTVESSRCPGRNFKRKTLNAFKIQSHLMFFDTSHNSQQTMFSNIYNAFVETATKSWAYTRCLPKEKRPSAQLIINTIKDLTDVSFLLLTSKSRVSRYPGYQCSIKKPQVAWLATVAFRQVLSKKQAAFGEVITWLEREAHQISVQKGMDCKPLLQAAKAPARR